ncbi:MAG: cytochrome c3 family protein [Pseudomonadota bacterium]
MEQTNCCFFSSKNVRRALGAACALALVCSLAWALARGRSHETEFQDKCSFCHVGLKDPSVLTRDADYLCLSCHLEQKKLSHPSGMIVTKQLPPVFPLYKNKLACITCHVAHKAYGENDSRRKLYDSNPYYLRHNKTGRVFCYQCHGADLEGFSINKTDSHAMGFEKAHTRSNEPAVRKLIDDGSLECLSCHDGTITRDASVSMPGVNWEHSSNIGMSHPIGVSFSDAFTRNPGRYRPLGGVDRRIMLFKGKVGCQSCHNHYSKLKHMLVMENGRSELCLQCHDL